MTGLRFPLSFQQMFVGQERGTNLSERLRVRLNKSWLTSVKLSVLSCVVSELIYGQLMGLIGQLLTILFPGI